MAGLRSSNATGLRGNTIKLSDSVIQRLRPTDPKGEEYPDHLVVGLRLRVGQLKKTWIIRKRVGSKVKNTVIGHYPKMGLLDARNAARDFLGIIEAGDTPPETAITFDKLVDRFIAEHAEPRTASWKLVKRRLETHVTPRWQGRKIDTIKRAMVQAVVDDIADKTPIQANRVLATLRTMFKFAMRKGLLEANPCEAVEKPGKENARDRFLDEAEITAFWQATDALGYPYKHYLRLLLLTGQRRTEVASMRWSDLDLDKGEWLLQAEDTKARRQHLIPLSAPALAILKTLPVIGKEGFVFTTGKSHIKGYSKPKEVLDALMANALEADGRRFKPWVLHDLRRTAATHMTRLGIPEHTVGKVLNHSAGPSVTARVYNIYSYSAEKRHALDTWAMEVMRLVGEAPAGNVVPLRGGQ